jgi:hypothetical protein
MAPREVGGHGPAGRIGADLLAVCVPVVHHGSISP